MSSDPPAGWYPDPGDPGLVRYWDGEAWTGHTGSREKLERAARPTRRGCPAPSSPSGEAAADSASRGRRGPGGRRCGRQPKAEAPKPLAGIAWAAYLVLGFALVANLAEMVVALDYSDKIQAQIDQHSVTYAEAVDIEDAFSVVSVLGVVALIGGAIGFLIWFHRAYANVPGITGQKPRFGRGWSIGSWFVPVLNLWRPKQIANDVWRGGEAKARGNPQWTALPVSTLLHWWWGLYLFASLLSGIAGGLLSPDPILSNSTDSAVVAVEDRPDRSDLQKEHSAAVIYAASSAFDVIAAATAIVFVRRASERQDERIGERREQGAST